MLNASYGFLWTFLLTSLLQSMVEGIAGTADKEAALGRVMTVGLAVGFVSYPLSGWISDRIAHRWFRRHGMVLTGVLGGVVCLALLPFATTTKQLTILFAGIQFTGTIACAPYFALLPELIPQVERGKASGAQGLADLVGRVAAFIVQPLTLGNQKAMQGITNALGLDMTPLYASALVLSAAMAVFLLVGLAFILFCIPVPAKEAAQAVLGEHHEQAGGLTEEQRKKGMTWLIISRIFNQASLIALQAFLLYYMQDFLKAGSNEKAVQWLTMVFLIATVATVPTVVLTGFWVDRYGRKIFLVGSSLAMMVVAIGFMLCNSLAAACVMGAFFGFALGMFSTSDWALAVDLVPGHDSGAFALGTWQSSLVLGQIVGVPVGTYVLTKGHEVMGKPNGYYALFTFIAICLALALVFLKPVPETLRGKKSLTTASDS